MTEQVYATVNDLPVIANEGDVAIIEADGSIYKFLNGLGNPTYSWLLSNDVSDNFSVKANILNSLDSFHISFWNFTSNVSGDDYFNINLKNQRSSITASNQILTMSDNTVAVKPISPFSENYPSSIRFNANSYIQSDSTFDGYDSVFKSFTVEGWYRNRKSSFSNTENTEAICNVDGNLTIKNKSVTLNGRDWSFTNNSNSNFTLNTWENFAYTYDGYDVNYFKDGVLETGTFDDKAEYSHGQLLPSSFQLDRDAGFQAKVYFASTSANNVLFQMGSGSERTILHIDNGILKLECHGLTASASNFPNDDDYHVVSWDYKVDIKRIRLFIDGVLKASAIGSPWIANYWGNKEIEGISDFGLVETSSVVMQDVVQGNEQRYYGGAEYGSYWQYTTPTNMTEVIDGNLFISDKVNYGPAYCVIGPSGTPVGNRHVMNPNSNDIYYFEISWERPSVYFYYDFARIKLHLMHAAWDGTNPPLTVNGYYGPYKSHIYEYNFFNSYGTGKLRYYYDANFDNSTTGYFSGGQGTNVTVRQSQIYSVFLDFANQRIIIFLDGSHYATEKFNLDRLNGRLPSGGGVVLAVQDVYKIDRQQRTRWNYNFIINGSGTGVSGAYPNQYSSYDLRRPEAKAKISFNSNDWFYDPSELHINYVQNKAAGTHSGGYNQYPLSETSLSTISSPHMYARSDNHISWMKDSSAVGNDSAYPHDLRYFPQCFNEMSGKILTIGADAVNQNPNNETGLSYAQAYVNETGGTIRTVNASTLLTYGNNLINYIQGSPSLVDGDAIYLEPGTYNCNQPSNYSTDGIHANKSVLICGSSTKDVIINFYSNRNRYFGLIFGSSTDEKAQLAFLTLNRAGTSVYNAGRYDSIFYNSIKGKAYKVIFDFANRSFSLMHNTNNTKKADLILEKCYFKDYSNYNLMTRGYAPVLKLIDNIFSGKFLNTGISSTTSHILIGDNKSYMTNYSDSSDFISGSLLDGHMKNFMIRSGVKFDSTFTPSTDLNYYDSLENNILVESFIGYKNLLRMSNDGVVYKKEVSIGSSDNSLKNTWVFNEINYDGTALTINKNGVNVHTFTDLFDSHSLDSCEVTWGLHDSYNVSLDTYVTISPQKDDLIHEILLDDNTRTYSSVPVEVREADSIDTHFSFSARARSVTSDSIVDVAGSITSTQAGPYASGSRAWFPQGSVKLGFDSISTRIIYDYLGRPIDSGLFVSYSDSIMLSDMIGDPYDLTVEFTMYDDVGDAIRWNVDNYQPERRIRVGYDSLNGGKFLIRQFRDSALDKDRLASVTFNAELINKISDSLPLFRLDVAGDYLSPAASPHTLTYHYLGVDAGDQVSPYHLQRMNTKTADSDTIDSDYIFIGDSGTSPSTSILYDNLGDLPS